MPAERPSTDSDRDGLADLAARLRRIDAWPEIRTRIGAVDALLRPDPPSVSSDVIPDISATYATRRACVATWSGFRISASTPRIAVGGIKPVLGNDHHE